MDYFEILSKVFQLNLCFYDFFHMTRDLIEKILTKDMNYFEILTKDINYFEILIKLRTNLRITYKDDDQIDGLLKKEYFICLKM